MAVRRPNSPSLPENSPGPFIAPHITQYGALQKLRGLRGVQEEKRAIRRGTVLRTVAMLAVPALPAAADVVAPDRAPIEEIRVTAERRSTDLQKTALALTVISPEALDKSNITELAGLNGRVPGLEITKSSGFETIVTLRGVGSETPENASITVPGVALFIDGVYIANTISLDQTLFDLDHIEVLRGPQGALFGQSAIGGAISLVTKQPELERFTGAGDVSFGDYGLHHERAEVNLPLGQDWAVRLSGQQYQHDGFTTNVLTGQKLDDANDLSGKIAVTWKPTDAVSATLTAQGYSADQTGAAQKNIDDPNPDPREVTQDYPSKFNLDTQLYHLNLQWDLPWFSLKSVSALQELDHRQQEDSSRSAYSILGSYDDLAAWNTSLQNINQEFDLLSLPESRLQWVGGVFMLSQHSAQFVAEFEGSAPNPVTVVTPDIETHPPANLAYGNYTYVARKSASPFLQATYPITEDLRVTAGGRFNYDSYDLSALNFSAFSIAPVQHRYSDHTPTWRLELEGDVTPDSLAYVSVSRGYKPGGVNGIASAVVVPESFKPETNTAFEIGSKNFLFDRLVRANFAGFYYDYRNMQYIETDPYPFDGGMANIPSVHVWGGEAEFSYVAFDERLRVNGTLTAEHGAIQGSYRTIDSTVQQSIEATNPACANGGAYYNPGCWAAVTAAARDIGGNAPPKMPDFAGSLTVAYAFSALAGALTPRVEYLYRGALWSRVFDEPGLDRVKAYGLWNLTLDYAPDDGNYTLSLTASNLANTAGVNSRYTDPYGTFQTSQQYIPPRQIIGTVGYSF
jgi:iron complex outermembrane receptor protein